MVQSKASIGMEATTMCHDCSTLFNKEDLAQLRGNTLQTGYANAQGEPEQIQDIEETKAEEVKPIVDTRWAHTPK